MTEPKHVRIVDGIPCITVTEHAHIVNKLRELLAGCQAREEHYRATLEMFLMPMPDKSTTVMDLLLAVTESAMEALALTADNTALKEALKQAKRDALLEAAEAVSHQNFRNGNPWASETIRRMAEELK
jgi:hypothetical protein